MLEFFKKGKNCFQNQRTSMTITVGIDHLGQELSVESKERDIHDKLLVPVLQTIIKGKRR